ETMIRNFRKLDPATRFDKDRDDWKVAGAALYNLRKDWNDQHERRSFGDWWCEQQEMYIERWPRHERQLRKLYMLLDDDALDNRHFKTRQTPPSRLVPCDLAKK